jgi:hypothetical protein
MEFGSFEEFSDALGRLYDSNLKNAEEIRDLRASISDLREAAFHLASAVEKDHDVIMKHERHLDRHEVTIEAILEDLRRHREGRAPQ